ncbi:hypothetical protein PTSG_02429 [Salpingoeca rosetta]|uniref:Uncharacterized protein n=1 Tax=Salpingoeca rosetta (strain ATCC 50818 / BSB-021) TaxID=946362 RepID=F2U266_SALR5|nr:uncharacterized protein PTSG_02429 [Salpingoeca rosetta]EGD81718.1 hypothetical protein PTSG_02429 [Salpingoeca rosetta]|eukprot:XP_004996922.1 hypothetical protein PTSG_02429 [Salpingoeca rosetta]
MSKRPRVERRPRLGPAIYDNAKRLRQKQSILDTLMKTKAFTESWSYLQRFGITWHWRTKPWLVPESEDRDYMSANEKIS